MKIIYQEQFKEELAQIIYFIKKDNKSAAKKFALNLKNSIENISTSPKKYRKSYYYDDENIRDMIYKGYTIIYKINNNSINIISIFNQNLPNLNDNTL